MKLITRISKRFFQSGKMGMFMPMKTLSCQPGNGLPVAYAVLNLFMVEARNNFVEATVGSGCERTSSSDSAEPEAVT
jgi:hypothetical protein